MSPIFVPIIFAIAVGLLIFIIGLFLRRKKLIFIGLPAVLLFAVWFILASWPPNPDKEFNRIFGKDNYSVASEIKTIKPTFMDGHFISFKISQKDFDSRIRPQFKSQDKYTSSNILGAQDLPNGWPNWIENSSTFTKEVDNQQIILVYGSQEGTAYASVWYEAW